MVTLLGPLAMNAPWRKGRIRGKGRDTVILEAWGEGHSRGLAPVAQLHGIPYVLELPANLRVPIWAVATVSYKRVFCAQGHRFRGL